MALPGCLAAMAEIETVAKSRVAIPAAARTVRAGRWERSSASQGGTLNRAKNGLPRAEARVSHAARRVARAVVRSDSLSPTNVGWLNCCAMTNIGVRSAANSG